MEKEMTGADRRKEILSMIRDTDTPVSGTAIGKKTGVSRQVVVQDIALLRTQGYPIISTARGYLLDEPKQAVRIFKVCHTNEQVEDELTTIVDLGGMCGQCHGQSPRLWEIRCSAKYQKQARCAELYG